jgi:hypothetical protein
MPSYRGACRRLCTHHVLEANGQDISKQSPVRFSGTHSYIAGCRRGCIHTYASQPLRELLTVAVAFQRYNFARRRSSPSIHPHPCEQTTEQLADSHHRVQAPRIHSLRFNPSLTSTEVPDSILNRHNMSPSRISAPGKWCLTMCGSTGTMLDLITPSEPSFFKRRKSNWL